MKRFLTISLFVLFVLTGAAQNNTRVIKGFVRNADGLAVVGATIKAIGENATTTSTQGGAFELRVSPYCQYVEASMEGCISAQAEIDGSMIILYLKVDKKYAENKIKAEIEAANAKAKLEEQARLAVEKELAAKAKAEAQAKANAEREAVAKAKAEAQAKANAEREAAAKARAEAQAKANTEREAATKAKTEEKRQVTEQRRQELKALNAEAEKASKMKFRQYVSVGHHYEYTIGDTHTESFNYIAGLRFNRHLYLGIGTGVHINTGKQYSKYDDNNFSTWAKVSRVSIPAFLHFRTDFAFGKKWNLYAAISAGGEFSTRGVVISECIPYGYDRPVSLIDHCNYLTTDVAAGANYKINKKLSLYFGISLGHSFDNFGFDICDRHYSNTRFYAHKGSLSLSHSKLKFTIGLSF